MFTLSVTNSFLRQVLAEKGVEVDHGVVVAVEKTKSPCSLKEVQAVLGLVGFCKKIDLSSEKDSDTLCKLLKGTITLYQNIKNCGVALGQNEGYF